MILNPYKPNEMFCLIVQISMSTEGEMLVVLNRLQIRLISLCSALDTSWETQ